jgi:hypothetical protein
MKWVGNVAYMENLGNVCRILVGSHKRDHLKDFNLYERIILKWLLKRKVGGVITGLMRFRI